MSPIIAYQVDSDKAAMKAIHHLADSKGASLDDMKRHLSSNPMGNGVNDLKSIQLHLKNAIGKGHLLKLDDGKYKIKETARRRRSRKRSGSRKATPKRRSRSRKRSGSKRRSSGGRRRRRRSSSGKKRKGSGRRRSKRRAKAAAAEEQ